jgi:hypothetical protein
MNVAQTSYRISGDPLHSFVSPSLQRHHRYKLNRIKWRITLESQLPEIPLSPPFSVEAHFYQNKTYSQHSLSRLFRFVEENAKGIAFPNLDSILSIKATRFKTEREPYTILIVTELESNEKE